MKALLSDRLYVPEEGVFPEAFEAYSYTFEEETTVRDSYGFSRAVKVERDVKLYKRVRGSNGGVFYGFARGNIPKLKHFFGDLEWVDKRAAPLMTSGLKFDEENFSLMNWEQHKRGQVEAVSDWLRYQNGIMRAPPRFGKTVCSIYIATKLGLKTLIVTHQEDLLNQFYKTFQACTNLEEITTKGKRRDATGKVVGFFQDYNNPEELDVCFLCYQTFGSKYGPERIKKYKDTWGLVIVDECHAAGAYKYSSIVNSLNSKHRLGLSGTVERTDMKEKIIHDILGPVVAEGKVEEVPCVVVAVKTAVKVPFKKHERPLFLYKRLYKDPDRLAIILKYLEKDVAAGRYICIGFHSGSSKQLEHFTEMLVDDCDYKAAAFHGKISNREEVLQSFRDGSVQIAVCNQRMLTGIDVPRWNCYYSLFPVASVRLAQKQSGLKLSGNYMQWFKRITTPFVYEDGKRKEFGIIRDFVDDIPFCYATYNKRLKAYEHQGYRVINVQIPKSERMLDVE